MKALIVLVVLLSATATQAQDVPFRVSLVVAVAAHGADLASTEYCLGARRCTEANPWLMRFSTQPAVLGAVKMGIAGLSLWGVAKLHETKPRLAFWVNVGMAGAFTAISVHNSRVSTP